MESYCIRCELNTIKVKNEKQEDICIYCKFTEKQTELYLKIKKSSCSEYIYVAGDPNY